MGGTGPCFHAAVPAGSGSQVKYCRKEARQFSMLTYCQHQRIHTECSQVETAGNADGSHLTWSSQKQRSKTVLIHFNARLSARQRKAEWCAAHSKNVQGPFFGPSHALHAKPPDQKERNHVYKFIALSESQASAQIQHLWGNQILWHHHVATCPRPRHSSLPITGDPESRMIMSYSNC